MTVIGKFYVVYRQTGNTVYTLDNPTYTALHGELADDCMSAFEVLTEIEGTYCTVHSVNRDGSIWVNMPDAAALVTNKDGRVIVVRH